MKQKNPSYYSNQKSQKKISNKWRKIFIFNFDPKNDEIAQTFLSKKIKDLLKKNKDEILCIFASKFNLNTILKTLDKVLKPKNGYIISDNGACLYDIGNKKIIYECPLKQEAKTLRYVFNIEESLFETQNILFSIDEKFTFKLLSNDLNILYFFKRVKLFDS